MNDSYFLLFIAAAMFLFLLIFCGEMLSQKIKSDLIKDMAKMEYYQTEINGKILWVKDKK